MKTVYFVEFDIDVDADKYGTYASLALTYAVANKKYSCRTVSQHRFPDSDSASSFMQRAAHCLDVVAATLAVEFVHFDYKIDETDARGVVAGEHAHECHEGAASVLSFSWIWRYDVDGAAPNVAEYLCSFRKWILWMVSNIEFNILKSRRSGYISQHHSFVIFSSSICITQLILCTRNVRDLSANHMLRRQSAWHTARLATSANSALARHNRLAKSQRQYVVRLSPLQ